MHVRGNAASMDADDTPRARLLLSIGGVLIVALAVRMAYFFAYMDNPGYPNDMDGNHAYAMNLLRYGVYGIKLKPTAFYPPGMALVLAAAYRMFGATFDVWMAVVVSLNVVICGLIWDIARRVFGPTEALIAGLIAAVYPQFLARTIVTDAKTLMQVGLCVGAWCLVREWQTGRRRWVFFAGLSFGVAYLGRSQLLLFPAFLPIWAYLRYRPDWARIRSATAIVILGMLPFMMGWIGRNYLTFGTFVAGSSGEGYPFASVNNPANYNSGRSRGLTMTDTAPSLFTIESGYVDADGRFNQRFVLLPELEQDRLFKEATFRWIRHNPGKMAILVLYKWKSLWLSPQSYSWPLWSRIFNVFLYLCVTLPFCVVGAYYVTRIDPPRAQPMIIWLVVAIYFTALHSAFEGELRHRIAFEPGMIILASAGMVFAYTRWCARALLRDTSA